MGERAGVTGGGGTRQILVFILRTMKTTKVFKQVCNVTEKLAGCSLENRLLGD